MKRAIVLGALATALVATPAGAQEAGPTLQQMLMQAMRLPTATHEARVLGVPESDLRTILDLAKEKRLPLGVLTEVIEAENQSIREHGPIDNFGAFVQARLGEGLRGRDLAAAIRAEHAARGKGKGDAKSTPAGKPGEQGKPDAAGKSGDHGKPDAAGKSGDHGKPDAAGKSGDHGTPDAAGKSGERGKPDAPGASGKKGGPR